MAIYRFSSQIIKRSEGRSATAAAAYRSAERIHDRTTGEVFDYTRKRGVFDSVILAPDFAPDWVYDRGELWNRVEEIERRGDAQLAREIELAIPVELTVEKGIALVREFAKDQFVDRGMIVDIAFHDLTSKNPHPHLLISMREITENGFGKKNRAWNDRGLITRWREQWANYANRYLENAGLDVRIDHRSYADQGLAKIPMIHMGPSVAAMERQGIATRIGDINRRIEADNVAPEQKLTELEDRWREVIQEIEFIRKESAGRQQTSGTLGVAPVSSNISARDGSRSLQFKTAGVASSIAEQFKAQLFLKTWNVKVDPGFLKQLRWIDTERRALTLNSGERIVDKGNRVNVNCGTDDAITAALHLIKAKGWQRVRLNGSEDFQVRAALALRKEGVLPKFTSPAAEQSFRDKLRALSADEPQHQDTAEEPIPKLKTQSIRESHSVPEGDIERLKRYVLEIVERNPLPSISVLGDNPKYLRKWARERWKEMICEGSPDDLADAFRAVAEEQAYLAGYSLRSVQEVGIDDELSTLLPGYKFPKRSKSYPNANAEPARRHPQVRIMMLNDPL